MSTAARRWLSRAGLALSVGLLGLGSAVSCGFPDHTFVDDDEFYGRTGGGGKAGANGGGSGVDSGAGGDQEGGGGRVNPGGGNANGGGPGAGGEPEDAGPVGRPDGSIPEPDGGAGGAEAGADADAAVDAAEAGPVCEPGYDACPPGVCVDFLLDREHCGDCETRCTGSNVCKDGDCQPPCEPGLTPCGGTCVDTMTDENNCGGCNRTPCSSGDICEDGTCVLDCDSLGLDRCGPRLCVDKQSEDLHCGNCTTSCRGTAFPVCVNGACSQSCSFPWSLCNTVCVNRTDDDDNCGTCGRKCPLGQDCVNSACTDLVEDCDNGTDDDEDGDVDCADSECTAYRCAGTPAGWDGPIAFWSGSAGTAPSCATSGGYAVGAFDASGQLSVPNYTCPSCTCTPSSGAFCDPLVFNFQNAPDCTDAIGWADTPVSPNECRQYNLLRSNGRGAQSIKLERPLSSYAHGTCTASQATPQLPPSSWGTTSRGCGTNGTSEGGGCSAGTCMRKPTGQFGAALCVYRAGVATCPADYPVAKPQYYGGFTDTRSCSTCDCGVLSCGGTVGASISNACPGTNFTTFDLSNGNLCNNIPPDPEGGGTETRLLHWQNAGAVCGTASSTQSGTVTPTSPLTVCCQTP